MRAAGIAAGAVLAIRVELLPERIDLVGFVLQFAGLGSLVALGLAVALGGDEGAFARYGTLVGAYTGLAAFTGLFVLQAAG